MQSTLSPTNIILHCSATPDGATYSWDAIRKYHMETNGWSDIGYHYGIERYGDRLVLLRGRKPFTVGAHCKAAGRNLDSLGVCVVGEYDKEAPSLSLYNMTIALLVYLCWTFHIPTSNVYGHREFESSKTCPGMKWNLDEVRGDIAKAFIFNSKFEQKNILET